MANGKVGIVAIGRNEGDRFRACLASLPGGVPAVYVDSGSTDGSVAHAQAAGVTVVHLSTASGFTAARARNAGWRELLRQHPDCDMVQFIDGDCALDAGWLDAAQAALGQDDRLAVVFGRRRERFPDASLYNFLCDREWDVPVGEVRACGGDALMRMNALVDAGGYNDGLIAGEEPDLCLRLRARGWRIRRIAAEMTLHDAAIHSLGAWWKRARRAGHAYAEHVWLHRDQADPDWVRSVKSMVFWGVGLPLLALCGIVAAVLLHPLLIMLTVVVLAVYMLQFLRLRRRALRTGLSPFHARGEAALLILSRFAGFAGMVTFVRNRLAGRHARLIEYK